MAAEEREVLFQFRERRKVIKINSDQELLYQKVKESFDLALETPVLLQKYSDSWGEWVDVEATEINHKDKVRVHIAEPPANSQLNNSTVTVSNMREEVDFTVEDVGDTSASEAKKSRQTTLMVAGGSVSIGPVLERAEMNLPALQAEARLQNDIKATKTITITIAAYFFSYVPAITYAIVGQQEENQADSWFGFFAWHAIFFSSAVNPIVYYLRFSRFRSVFRQFLKNPFGTIEFKEKPSRVYGKRRGFNATTKDADQRRRIDEIETRKKYHGKRRNGMVISSIQALQAHLCVLEFSEICGDGRANQLPKKREVRKSTKMSSPVRLQTDGRATSAPSQQVMTIRDRKEEKKNEGNEMSEKKKLENGTSKRNHARSRTNVYPLSTQEILGVEDIENAVAYEETKEVVAVKA